MSLTYRLHKGPAIEAIIAEVAALRIRVFYDWPYLYEGDEAYERDYLSTYVTTAGAVVVTAEAEGRIVGASTGLPMLGADADFSAPFISGPQAAEMPADQVFYLAESVLLSDYRGQGAGHAFFDLREGHARDLGLRYAALCSVIRPDDHPMRPAAYRPLDAFWSARGYRKLDGVLADYHWKDIGDTDESAKPMQFWARDLTAS